MKTIEDIKYLMVGKGLITDLADLLRANDEEFAESEKNYLAAVEQNEKEKKAVMARLIALDRQDLIDTYYGGKKGGVDLGC